MDIVEMLDNGRVVFRFRKRDGSIRTMHATRSRKIIPKDMQPADVSHLNLPEVKRTAVTVFDTEINEWRSFKPDSVIDVIRYTNF